MKSQTVQQSAVSLFQQFAKRLAEKLPTKTTVYFLSLITGALLAIARRRTVTQWLKAAQMSEKFRQAFHHLPNIGRKSEKLLDEMLTIILEKLEHVINIATSIRIVIDDSPTKRYGRKIEGAGYHHNPTPGRTNAKTCFGHSWVVAVLVITHPAFGTISFPIAVELYLREREIAKLKAKYSRQFQKKTDMAVAIIKRLVPKFTRFGKPIEVIVDNGYANSKVLIPLDKFDNVSTVTRLRRDAALYLVPVPPKKRGRGRPKVYGDKIDVKAKAETNYGWKYVECFQYGKMVKKRTKTFTAASRLTGGKPVKIVLVKEDDTWVPLMSTDVKLGVKEILESYGVRFGIEETFKDLKEVCGWGKQEVRRLESNEAMTAMNMVLYGLTELATWDCGQAELVDRRSCPWDDPERRPSHADRRNYLRFAIIANELNDSLKVKALPTKIVDAIKRLIKLAA